MPKPTEMKRLQIKKVSSIKVARNSKTYNFAKANLEIQSSGKSPIEPINGTLKCLQIKKCSIQKLLKIQNASTIRL